MALDFKRAADLFISTEEELAMALGIPVADLRSYRQKPGTVPDDVLKKMGDVLVERGQGMARVGEMLQE